jgi:hypothetical protein
MKIRALVIALALCGGLPCLTALAQDPDEEAHAHFQNGIELYQQSKYEESAIEFNRAYQLKPSYRGERGLALPIAYFPAGKQGPRRYTSAPAAEAFPLI